MDLIYGHLITKLPTEDATKFSCPCEKTKKKCQLNCFGNNSCHRECPISCKKSCSNRHIANGTKMVNLNRTLHKRVGQSITTEQVILPDQLHWGNTLAS